MIRESPFAKYSPRDPDMCYNATPIFGHHKLNVKQLKSIYPSPNMRAINCCVSVSARLGSPAHSAGNLSSPCTRVWRTAISFFLIPIRFFAVANHQADFSPWRDIGWFNTMTTGKQRQAANRVQSNLN